MRIYVSGPMEGKPGKNFAEFNRTAEKLLAYGYEVSNPAAYGDESDLTWSDCLRRDLVDLVGCDAVCVLPGWQDSRGATLEVHVARALGMPVEDLSYYQLLEG